MVQLPTIQEMLKAGTHFGHQTRYWHPKMAPYIYCARNKLHIIDLEHTMRLLKQALEWLEERIASGDTILFVGTKQSASKLVKKYAESIGMPYVCHRWLGGALTNYKTISSSIRRLRTMEEQINSEYYRSLPKREAIVLLRAYNKLEYNLGGVKDMQGLPDILFVLDVDYEQIAIREAHSLNIPVVAIVDTNGDPSSVSIPIPGNDDSFRAIDLYLRTVIDACIAGKARAQGMSVEEYLVNFPMAENSSSTVPPSEEVSAQAVEETDVSAEAEPAEAESAESAPAEADPAVDGVDRANGTE